MKIIKLLLFTTFLLFNATQAQDLFTQGYVLTTSGDTVSGLIENQNWLENPNTIRFKESSTSEVRTYSPSDIAGFGMWTEMEEHYRGVNMEIDFTPVKTPDLLYSKDRQLVRTNTFLRIRVLGRVSLYDLRDSSRKEHYFIQKDQGEIVELIYHRYIDNDNPQTSVVRVVSMFKNQLSSFLAGCDKIGSDDINKSKYTLFHISRLVRNYNTCIYPDEIQYIAKKDKPKLSLGVMVGASVSSVLFRTGFSNTLQSIEYDFAPGFLGGLALNVQLPRNNGRNAMRIEGIFNNRKFKAQWTPDDNSSFSVPAIQLNLLYQYRGTNSGKVNPYFGIGLSFDQSLKQFEVNSTVVPLLATQFVTTERRNGVSGIFNVGVLYENMYLDFRYNHYFNTKLVLLGEVGSLTERSFQVCLAWFLL